MAEETKINYNWEALRGTGVDDMEYIEHLGLDPSLAYTPQFIDAMLDLTYEKNIEAGTSEDKAKKLRAEGVQYAKKLLAKNGILNNWKPIMK